MRHHLFVYGSLKDPSIFESITGDVPHPKKNARLPGYAHAEPCFGYPVIRPQKNGIVTGEIIYNVSEEAFKKLDEYEEIGTLYQRTQVSVQTEGKTITAFVYTGI
jgi:gamma-glutamylcyclotransferase (GGCT)/AIG2-like uncharacterized protein YtfP